MIVEILGAKMLAPYVGTSQFVWTAQIAITLVALAVGYYFGGRQADRSPSLARLYGALLLAAVYLCAVTLALRPVAEWCLGFPLALGSLLASAFLFFVPLALLAITSPFLARVVTASLTGVGGSVGRLTAISTLGSFVGTVLIGYVLIPLLPNSITLLLTAGLVAAPALIYFTVWRRRRGAIILTVLALGLGAVLGTWGQHHQRPVITNAIELFRGNSNFGDLAVLELQHGRRRYYLNDLLFQNTYDPVARASLSTFTYLLHGLATAYTPAVDRVLCIGLGVGIVPGQFARDGAHVEVVEINPAVVDVARRFFDCPIDQLQVIVGDGRQFVNRTTNHYDTIILDAFLGDSSPSHLMSREAFQSMRARLNPHGTLVINAFADFSPGRDFLGTSLLRTLSAVFRSVRVHGTGSGNVYYVASDRIPFEPVRFPDFSAAPASVYPSPETAFNSILQPDPRRGIVLTDDFNPADYHDARNREQIRRNLIRTLDRL